MANGKNKKSGIICLVTQNKSLAFFIVLILVVAINHVVFSYLLQNREKARAFSSAFGAQFFSYPAGFTGANILPGTNMQLLADFWLPNGWTNDALTCSYQLGSACFPMVDADGAALGLGSGVDDDSAAGSPFNLVPYGGNYGGIFFRWNDWYCADNCLTPTEFYKDGGDGVGGYDCIPGNGGTDITFLDTDLTPAVLDAGPYTNVGTGWNYCSWIHSELVNANGLWDYCDPAVIPGCGAPETETVWKPNLIADTVLAQGSDWDNPVLGQYQGDPFAAWVGSERFVDLDATTIGGFDGIATEPVIIDLDGDNLYENGPDTLIDADGWGSTAIGTDNDTIPPGSAFNQIALTDGVCWNGANQGGLNQMIVYIDGGSGVPPGPLGPPDCIPGNSGVVVDKIIRNDTPFNLAAIIAGLGTFPFTFFPANALYYFDSLPVGVPDGKYTAGANAANTESLWLQIQGVNQWSPNIEGGPTGLLDADGIGGLGSGFNNDLVARGIPLTYLQPTDNVCFAVSNIPGVGIEDIYVDQVGPPGECNPFNDPGCAGPGCFHPFRLLDGSGGPPDGLNPATTYDGTYASAAGSAAYFDHLSPGGVPGADGVYTYGFGNNFTESLWLELLPSATYTASADTDVYSTGLALAGDALTIGTGPSGQNLYYLDADSSGTLTSNDTIVEDNGNVQTGPGGVPNNVLDRINDYVQMAMISNAGTALPGTDISNMYFCSPGADAWCGTGDAGEFCFPPILYQSAESAWFDPAMSPLSAIGKICIFADISLAATAGRTIQLQIPQLVDTGATPGLYDAGVGEKGIFNFSGNDGPVGGPATVPYIFTISPLPVYTGGGGAPADTTPPTNVTKLKVIAGDTGKVSFTWQDPTIFDFSKLIISEEYQGQTKTETINSGVQTLVLTGRQVGGTYKYLIYTTDASGNQSAPIELLITIPSQGEIEVVPEIPSPVSLLPGPEITLPFGFNIGDLLKNSASTTVYIIGKDNKRHVFPNEATFFTWFADFSKIKVVSNDILSQIPLDSNVTVRPGTKLVKIQTDSRVYAVEPGAILRPIKSEAIASALYGWNWKARILDVPDVFFVDYTTNSEIAQAIYPAGSLIQYAGSTERYYIESNAKRLVTAEIFSANQYMLEFLNKNVAATMVFVTGENLPQKSIVDQMYFK
jgi:hypothetical protein